MIWKKFARLIPVAALAVVVALVVAGCGSTSSKGAANSSAAGQKSMTLRLADDQPKDYPTVLGDEEFAKLVRERTNGRINIVVYPNSQLGDENTVAQQIQLGAIDFARINAAPLADYDKELGVFNLPYLFSSSKQMWDVLDGPIGSKILAGMTSAKMVGLAYYDSGARCFYNSQKPVAHPGDLKGMKIRVQQSQMYVALVKALGASPVPMSYGDVYSALQTHVIDGAENNWPSYYSTNHYQVAKYFTEDDHTRTPEILLASQATWNKLSPADQKIIARAARDSEAVERQAWNQLEQKAVQAAKANGNVITRVNVAEWQKAVQPIYDQYGAQYKDLIAAIRATK